MGWGVFILFHNLTVLIINFNRRKIKGMDNVITYVQK